MFSCEFCKVLRTTIFIKHLWWLLLSYTKERDYCTHDSNFSNQLKTDLFISHLCTFTNLIYLHFNICNMPYNTQFCKVLIIYAHFLFLKTWKFSMSLHFLIFISYFSLKKFLILFLFYYYSHFPLRTAVTTVTITKSTQWRYSVKKAFLQISKNSQENTCARVSFLIKLQLVAYR